MITHTTLSPLIPSGKPDGDCGGIHGSSILPSDDPTAKAENRLRAALLHRPLRTQHKKLAVWPERLGIESSRPNMSRSKRPHDRSARLAEAHESFFAQQLEHEIAQASRGRGKVRSALPPQKVSTRTVCVSPPARRSSYRANNSSRACDITAIEHGTRSTVPHPEGQP